jgi:hypothetical protein
MDLVSPVEHSSSAERRRPNAFAAVARPYPSSPGIQRGASGSATANSRWPLPAPGLVVPPAVSVPPVKDLFAQDVGVACVLREFTQHLQLQRPHGAAATAVDDCVEAQGNGICRFAPAGTVPPVNVERAS